MNAQASATGVVDDTEKTAVITIHDDQPGLASTEDATYLYNSMNVPITADSSTVSEKTLATEDGAFSLDCKEDAQAKSTSCVVTINAKDDTTDTEINGSGEIAEYRVDGEVARNLYGYLPHTESAGTYRYLSSDNKLEIYSFFTRFMLSFDGFPPPPPGIH